MPKPNKGTLAKMKVLSDAGHTPNRIGKALGHDPKSIRTWLKATDFNDPEIKHLIEKIKAEELDQLRLIGGKARAILSNYLDDCLEGAREPNPISVTAILDRTFQQRRLLEGQSTENVSVKSITEHYNRELLKAQELLRKLETDTENG